MLKKINDLISQTKTAFSAIKAEIQSIDEQIEAKEKDRQVIFDAPLSKEDYLYFVEQEIKVSADKFSKNLAKRIEQYSTALPSLMRNNEAGYVRDYIYIPQEEGFLYFYFGKQILEGVCKAVSDNLNFPSDAMPYKERVELVKKLDAEIQALNTTRDDLAQQLSCLQTM